jgi:uncharacterized membrane protein YphA (DoxX/SURF4 family)
MNPFSDSLVFLSAGTGDFMALGVWRWLVLALFYALALASAIIAISNWSADATQRTTQHVGMGAVRFLVGCMWFQGMLWKLPFSPDNGLHYWLEQMAGRAAFQFHRDLVANFLLPHFTLVNPLVFLAELAFASSLILGFGVRLVAFVAIFFGVNLWLGIYINRGSDPAEWSWSYMFLIMLHVLFVLYAAGRSLGADALLRRRGFVAEGKTGVLARVLRLAT